MSNQAYLQGVAEALSQMDIDPQIKVASYNELEKVASGKLIESAKALGGRARDAIAAAVSPEAKAMIKARNMGAMSPVQRVDRLNPGMGSVLPAGGAEALALLEAKGLGGAAGRTLMGGGTLGDAALLGGTALAGGAGLYGAGYGVGQLLDDEEELEAERNRNLALALGGTALAGGLGYGAYKALS